jgi:hypothetical protein
MTSTSATRLTVLFGGAALVLGLGAGCGSSKPGASPAGGAGLAGLPTTTAGVGNNGSVDAKVCAAIANDVAAITKNVSSPATFPGQCAFDGGATTVTFFLNDPQHTDVTNVIGTGAQTISGIGDGAVWIDSNGQMVPNLGAWKGSVSCLVQPDSDATDDTVPFTGTPPFIKIADADAAAYAQKLGAVCNDVFTAAG